MTDTQTEARAIVEKLQDVVDGTDGWLNVDKAADIIAAALAAKDEKIQALNDECQQSMLDIARERDRAERAEAELAEVKVSNNKWLAKWERAEAELAELRQELGETRLVLEQTERNAKRIIKVRDAQLAETRKAMNYLNDAVAVGLSDQEVSRRAKMLVSARRALTGGSDD